MPSPSAHLTPTTLWSVSAALVLALDDRLGMPVDSYVNGTQTWLTEDAAHGLQLEWRLHPVASYRPPTTLSHYDLWEQVLAELGRGAEAETLALGGESRALDTLWAGLECYPPYDSAVEPAVLAAAARERLGVAPEWMGLVDHDRIGSAWERSGGRLSLAELVRAELEGTSSDARPAGEGP